MFLFFFSYFFTLQATWNMAMLQTEDILKAVQSTMNKEEPVFSKL